MQFGAARLTKPNRNFSFPGGFSKLESAAALIFHEDPARRFDAKRRAFQETVITLTGKKLRADHPTLGFMTSPVLFQRDFFGSVKTRKKHLILS